MQIKISDQNVDIVDTAAHDHATWIYCDLSVQENTTVMMLSFKICKLLLVCFCGQVPDNLVLNSENNYY